MFPLEYYNGQINLHQAKILSLTKRKNLISAARVFTLLLAIGMGYLLFPGNLIGGIISLLLVLAIFLRLVLLSVSAAESLENENNLLTLYQQEIKISEGSYTDLPQGMEWAPAGHDYSHDLDIFGRASLYQYLNRARSQQGNQTFAGWLLAPATSAQVLERQAACRELSGKQGWCRQLNAFGLGQSITLETEKKVTSWLNEPNHFSDDGKWKVLRILLPIIACIPLFLFFAGLIPLIILAIWAFLFFIISSLISRQIQPHYEQLDRIIPQISVLGKSAHWIENGAFDSLLLQQLQQPFSDKGHKSSSSIKSLKGILDRFDYRLNPLVFIPLNIFLLWDLQLIFQLEKWRSQNPSAASWFRALGQWEAISSLGTASFNHPAWAFPTLDPGYGSFSGRAVGHPLIPLAKRVTSDFSLQGPTQLALVTGSNMAGKSTFLRSIGINMVLALAGGPVCAQSLQLSLMRVMSSMRISDNLEESTSTFYAELKKLKTIIDSINQGEPVFILLDEILRGTNSLDRHSGSTALIRQWMKKGASGLLATHDIELTKLAAEYPGHIHNFHFDVQVQGEELYFDYQLKPGICQSMNASLLMKKIGIEL